MCKLLTRQERKRNMLEYFLKTLISAVVAYLTPKALSKLGHTLESREFSRKGTLPVLPWLLAGAIGGAAGSAFSAAMGNQGAMNWAAYGAALGIMQWLVLRNWLPVGAWWALASALGWATFPFIPNVGSAVVGLSVGVLQIIGLKANGKGWWVAGNLVAWILTGFAAILVASPIGAIFGPVAGWLIGWGLIGFLGFLLLLFPLSKLDPLPKEA